MSPIRVLVIDDSPTMRRLIASTLERDDDIEVVGYAGDPFQGREAIKALNPDVVTLDVEMPGMDGLAFLEKIIRLRPMPVVMVSTLTQAGAGTTLQALEIGAVDCVGKPDLTDLVVKVKAAAKARVIRREPPKVAAPQARSFGNQVVFIGSSTGGVEALISVLSHFPAQCPPTVITQHMPPAFTKSFAARLDRLGPAQVTEAFDGAPIRPGQIYLAPGGDAHLEVTGRAALTCKVTPGPKVNGHSPSVDVLFRSAVALGARSVGVILTGMGRDGAQGLLAMREAGASTIGQDESSSVVYGMPKAAFALGAVERQIPLSSIGPAILEICSASVGGSA